MRQHRVPRRGTSRARLVRRTATAPAAPTVVASRPPRTLLTRAAHLTSALSRRKRPCGARAGCPRAPSPCATRAFPTGKRGREVGGSCEKGSRGSRSDDRWRRRRSGGASDQTRARRTPPRHAMLPHLGVMLRRRARRGERGEKKVCEAQATKGGLGLSVSLRRRACTRLCLLLQLQSAKCTPLIRLQFRGTSRARSERYKAVGPPRESRWNVVGVPTRKSLVENAETFVLHQSRKRHNDAR